MVKKSKGFAAGYRPETFAAVWGQTHPVQVLSGLIKNGQQAYNLLLHGAVGSGKTSLVRLFERALNCDRPTEDGSPCGACPQCQIKDRAHVGLQEYDVSGRGGDREDFALWLRDKYRTPTTYKWQVLFFDEAHSLKGDATDSLLKRIEEPIDNVVFCFATTEYERLRPALRSRTIQLEVRPLSAAESIRRLQEVAAREGITYENEALALLAGVAGGQPRDLLNALDEVSTVGKKLTEQYVREYLDVDHKPAILAYFRALADANFERQTEVIDNWRETLVEKTKWIATFLLALYYNDICGVRLIVDPIIHSITTERSDIIARFQKRFGVASAHDLAPYWRAMLEFWNEGDVQEDSTALLKLTLFHLLVNDDPKKLLAKEGSPPTITRKGPQVNGVGTAHPTATAALDNDQEFLTPKGAGMILDLASFLIQEYGVGFNAAFEIYPSRIGAESESAARSEIERFVTDLIQVATAGKSFAHLTLLERYEGSPRGLIVAQVPHIPGEGVQAWQTRVRQLAECWSTTKDVVRIRLSKGVGVDWKFHWDETLNLCAGVWEDDGPSIPFDRLKVPKRLRRKIGPMAGGVLRTSENLSPERLEEAARDGLAPLSAVQDEAWDYLRSKWELKEHADRTALRKERDEQIAAIEATHRHDPEIARVKVAEFRQSWRLDPHARPRKWTPWPKRT